MLGFHISSYKKPIILSTGASNLDEIIEAVSWINSKKVKLALLHCVLNYPTENKNAHLGMIKDLQANFPKTIIGYSDHTLGIEIPVAAVALGATVIEKHFTLNRTDGGVDSAFSLEPNELATLVTESERAWRSIGTVVYGPTEAEEASLVFRRSLYFVEDLRAGDLIREGDIRRIRPGHGLAPRFESEIIGRKVRVDITRGTPVQWALLD